MKNYWFLLALLVWGCQSSSSEWQYVEKLYTQELLPTGVAHLEGQVYVSSRKNDLIANINREGRVTNHNAQFKSPHRILARGNKLVVPEFDNNRFGILSGSDIDYYPLADIPDGTMAADFANNKVVVADYNGHRVIYYHGSQKLTWGEEGSGKGQFRYPTDIQIYGNEIYVADNQNQRVQVYNEKGEYARTIGGDGVMRQASGLFVWDGGVVVCDKTIGGILIYSHQGKHLQTIKKGFEQPSDAVVVGNVMYVADELGGYVGVLEKT